MPERSQSGVTASVHALEHVADLAGANVRIFLAEVAEGVSHYRSLHNLTQQVEHQYHGRFLIELIQNGHDALSEERGAKSRILVRYDPEDSQHGSLLVANDGLPFTSSNFERISQLGQSDKDPQKSIGNKGIGFRSVLEIAEAPEIYSRSVSSSAEFDGYCFAFRPSVVASLVEPMQQLALGGDIPVWSETGEPIVQDWSEKMLAKFRRRVRTHGGEWLSGETKYLSPYLLPVPLSKVESAAVQALQAQGFATVVRLPIKSADLRDYVHSKIEELDCGTVLFLDKITKLEVQSRDIAKCFNRSPQNLPKRLGGARILIEDGEDKREYGVWQTELHVPTAPEDFRKAVSELPGRWPEITDITVSVAVRLGPESEEGRFSIYLPTRVKTGGAVHVNAPFFGDMSRTSISFADRYNKHLLERACDLVIEVVRKRLAGRGEMEARAVVDLLSPMGDEESGRRWLQLLDEAAARQSASITEEPLFLSRDGWTPLNTTSLVPEQPLATVLTSAVLRRHATFNVFHDCLTTRSKQLRALAQRHFPNVGAYPLASDLAETVGAVAQELKEASGDWNTFWRETAALLPGFQAELAKHPVLLGSDGQLHAPAAGVKVFFVPRQGTPDDSDVAGEAAATDVPRTLRTRLAFLSDKIELYDPKRPISQTPVRAYLGTGLVSTFRVETIFTEVLQDLVPELPAALHGPDNDVCKDVLIWAFRLMGNVVARGRGVDATLRLLRTIPVPCVGGWFAMKDATFGAGWENSRGETLSAYLQGLNSEIAADMRSKLLLPPDDARWGGVGPVERDLLGAGGVVDGLRIYETKSEAWQSRFYASAGNFKLPGPPPSLTDAQWAAYKKKVEGTASVGFVSFHLYEVGSVFTFPGMSEFQDMPEEKRLALSELLLESIGKWSVGLSSLVVSKVGGQWSRIHLESPLRHFLRMTPWLAVREAKGYAWSRPAERWFVPAETLSGRARHYTHLKALPVRMASDIGRRAELASVLKTLGMPFFDPHADTDSPMLLEALARAVGSDDVSETNVLLGQIREAWHRFRPGEAAGQKVFPLAVRTRDKGLHAVLPSASEPAYLPDSGAFTSELEELGLPVIAIEPLDAKELGGWFATVYQDRVVNTSSLALIPQVQGDSWAGKASSLIAESELSWLIAPLLVLVAQNRGVHSAAFQARVSTLKTAKLEWVPDLCLAVTRDAQVSASRQVPALWDSQTKTLIVTEQCKLEMEEMSGALAQCLEREDLLLSIAFMLRSVRRFDDDHSDVAALVSPVRVSGEHVQHVLEHLRGDIGHISRLVALLVRVIRPAADCSFIEDADSEEDVSSGLRSLLFTAAEMDAVIRAARESQDLFEFGKTTCSIFGRDAELPRWNTVLRDLGLPELANRSARTQLRAWFEELAWIAKRLITQAIRGGTDYSFIDMWSQYRAEPEQVDLSAVAWQVGFEQAAQRVAHLSGMWGVGERGMRAILGAHTPEELELGLASAGVEMSLDPDEIGRQNAELVNNIASAVDRMRLASWVQTATESDEAWTSGKDLYRLSASHFLAAEGFTRLATEAEVFAMLKDKAAETGSPQFRAAVRVASDTSSLQAHLGLSEADLSGAEARLNVIRAERMRRRNVVKVCGEDFDSSDDNLHNLWELLQKSLPDESLAASPHLDLMRPAALLPPPKKRERRADQQTATSRRPLARQPKAVDELIGLFGEIYVFRMLRRMYGEDAVSSSAWVSENSRRVFPSNQTDDGRGCDFAFTVKGRQYRVEVKATSGDDDSFTLGSSEIRLAMDVAGKGKRGREVFVLVHVKKALSTQPVAVVLNNPYDPKHASVFDIEEADARVRYRLQ